MKPRFRYWPLLISALSCALCIPTANAAHAFALGAKPKYPPNFQHFDYVNPNAPRGGHITLANPDRRSSFDSFNPFILKGLPAAGVAGLMFETLAVGSADEPASVYGRLANDITVAPDKLSVTFTLNPRARFSNGDPVTAHDVKFSFDTLNSKAAAPQYRAILRDVRAAVVIDPRTIRYDFKQLNNELPLIVAALPVFSAKWLNGRALDKVTLEKPIGSGPYLIDTYDVGRRITFKRNPAYWGNDLPTTRGIFNFDRVTFIYYKDRFATLEAFKAGEFDYLVEYSARNWARSYIGPKFRRGELVRKKFEHRNTAGMQGIIMNLRRPLFQDIRVRKALGLALDYEWMNRNMFYGEYKRIYSYYSNGELAATETPSPDELKLLNPLRSLLYPEVFGPTPVPPNTDPPNSLRQNLRQAQELLAQAGWTYRDGGLRNKNGELFHFEYLDDSGTGALVFTPFERNLRKLGIRASFRHVDYALYQRRLENFDYDMITLRFPDTESPGNELVDYYMSSSADIPGSNNIMGLKNQAVDALINKILVAPTRRDLVSAVHALDRVLLHGHYVIPEWYNDTHRVAYVNNKFGMPQRLPLYYRGEDLALAYWWDLKATRQ